MSTDETEDNIFFNDNLVLVSSCVLVIVKEHITLENPGVQKIAVCKNQSKQHKLSDH